VLKNFLGRSAVGVAGNNADFNGQMEEIQNLFSIKAGERGLKLLTEIHPKQPRGLMLDEVILLRSVGTHDEIY